MTVAKLKELLADAPDNMEIVICRDEDFAYAPLKSVKIKNVRWCEDPDNSDKEPFSDELCVVLDV